MAFKKPRARAERREAERRHAKLVEDAERIFRASRGGSPEYPIELGSASEVEVRATSMACPLCAGNLRVEEHTAQTLGTRRLRIVGARCAQCGVRRAIYFRLGSVLPS
jgi:hypothetical protein